MNLRFFIVFFLGAAGEGRVGDGGDGGGWDGGRVGAGGVGRQDARPRPFQVPSDARRRGAGVGRRRREEEVGARTPRRQGTRFLRSLYWVLLGFL